MTSLSSGLGVGTAGFGFVVLWNLWTERLSQLRRPSIGRLLLSLPLALLGLAGGLGALLLAGYLTEKFPAVPAEDIMPGPVDFKRPV